MDGSQTTDTGTIETLESSDPQFQIRIDRVLDQDRNIYSFQCIGDLLYGERINRCTGSDPQHVDPCFQCFENMVFRCHFGSHIHTCFLFYPFQPLQAFCTNSFESTRFGTRFPDSCAEQLDAFVCDSSGRFHYLLFCLSATRTGDYNRTLRVYTG